MEEETRSRSLKQEIAKEVVNELREEILAKKKGKEKNKLKIKLDRKKILKNYVYYILLKDNGAMETKKMQIQDNKVYISENKTYHEAMGNHIWLYKGNIPVMIQPLWSSEPITKDYLVEKSLGDGTNTQGQQFMIKMMELVAAGLKYKKEFKVTWILYAGIVLAVIYVISLIAGNPIL